jgi:hypothetical protein
MLYLTPYALRPPPCILNSTSCTLHAAPQHPILIVQSHRKCEHPMAANAGERLHLCESDTRGDGKGRKQRSGVGMFACHGSSWRALSSLARPLLALQTHTLLVCGDTLRSQAVFEQGVTCSPCPLPVAPHPSPLALARAPVKVSPYISVVNSERRSRSKQSRPASSS